MDNTITKPLVSIVVPTYKKVALALETLKSIRDQTYLEWECIVVDDGSTRSDFSVLQEFITTDKRFTLHKRPEHAKKGANACRNYGMLLSKGKYIQFFDSDDLMMPTCLEGRVNTIETGNYDFVVYCMALIYGDKKVLDNDLDFVSNWEDALNAFLGPKKLPWNLQRTLFKTTLIKETVFFNENLARFQDIEFNINMLINCKPKFIMIQKFDCYYRFVSNQNKRTGQFNTDVFKSIPVFLKSITDLTKPKEFDVYRIAFQERIYRYISLYTVKSISFQELKKVLTAAKKYIGVTAYHQLILIFLFYGKKYFKLKKGRALYFKILKKLYT
jgi:glycosyltransferase involved in cell wall biosynthesis